MIGARRIEVRQIAVCHTEAWRTVAGQIASWIGCHVSVGQQATNHPRLALSYVARPRLVPSHLGQSHSSQLSCDRNVATAARSYIHELPAKARRNETAFERSAAHTVALACHALHQPALPVSWRREKLSRIEGVSSCGQLYIHSGLGCAAHCLAVGALRANRRCLAQGPGRLGRFCWTQTRSLASPSASQPMSFIAKKTPVNAEVSYAAVKLTRQPCHRAAPEIHANTANGRSARLRCFAFRHTKVQGTANV